jgi:hypothetical protein
MYSYALSIIDNFQDYAYLSWIDDEEDFERILIEDEILEPFLLYKIVKGEIDKDRMLLLAILEKKTDLIDTLISSGVRFSFQTNEILTKLI